MAPKRWSAAGGTKLTFLSATVAHSTGPGAERARRVLLILMPILALAPRLWIAMHSQAADASIFDTGFGFGDYIRNLSEQGSFRSCSFVPFDPCNPRTCTFATRMPGLPVLLASLGKFVGTRAVSVAVLKCVLLALLSAGFLAALSRDVRITTTGLIILYGLYFGPQPLKHGAALEYEEGVLIDLSLCLAVAVSYLLRPEQASSGARLATMGIAAVIIATVMYFTKTTALLTLFVVVAMVLIGARTSITGGARAAGIAVVGALSIAWAAHNLISSSVFSLSSSWNGENLFRGYDSGALAIYPEISLDRIFDAERAVLDDGTVVRLGAYRTKRCFVDEWTWSSNYSRLAREWLVAHPSEAAVFLGKRAWVTLLEVRHTPKYVSATDKQQESSPLLRAAMTGWMMAARLAFFLLIVRIVLDLRAGRNRTYAWALALLLAACAPYIMVFAYQRHTIPILQLAGGLLAILYFAHPAKFPSSAASSRPMLYSRGCCSES